MNRGTVTSVATATGYFACGVQLQGGPTVTAYSAGPVPPVGARVWLEDMGAGSWLILGQQQTNYPAPWNLPWGFIARNTGSAAITVGTTSQTVVSVAFTALANRWYEINLTGLTFHPAANTTLEARLGLNSGGEFNVINTTTASDWPSTGTVVLSPSAGANTARLNYNFVAGGGAANSFTPANSSWCLTVKDIGPNGNPAVI